MKLVSRVERSLLVDRLQKAGCVFAVDEVRLLVTTARTITELEVMVEAREAGRPLEHILGWAEFRGLHVRVDPGIFVPRRRTEFLVRQALTRCHSGTVVVDLCCGSGAVGAAVAAAVPLADVFAADIDPAAVRCARRNLDPVKVFEGDLFEALPTTLRGHVDVLVVNAPYVPTARIELMPPEARLHEARVALDGGADGLDVQRRVVAESPLWLAPGGHLLIETSTEQAPHTAELLIESGLTCQVAHSHRRNATVVVGTSPESSLPESSLPESSLPG
ncbi:putative protein N(5)-glutamine methyltransferase [Cryobacterium roopkundense]|uniref:peptide chain release factor N(5)-glutamine methyltransferase n=1 Tax=Cryobacterium roopkundense TaxID=1001240 RepID=A0A7W8ZTR7_9MICO|nr:putative protein N(5)-glutamine methyltransferase [Cryobacterium roopkundense]MBB5640034.1 release factor glutamine methyltransferase [Cryobacterium roopkundense]